MRWRKLSGRGVYKWTDAGQSLQGKWLGSRDGNFGLLGTIETAEGSRVTFPLTAVLADRLADAGEGSLMRVVCLGPAVSDAGRQYKKFDVFAGEEGADDDGEVGEPSGDEQVSF